MALFGVTLGMNILQVYYTYLYNWAILVCSATSPIFVKKYCNFMGKLPVPFKRNDFWKKLCQHSFKSIQLLSIHSYHSLTATKIVQRVLAGMRYNFSFVSLKLIHNYHKVLSIVLPHSLTTVSNFGFPQFPLYFAS